MLVNIIVKVWAGIIEVDELILVNYIVLDTGFTVHKGVSINEVPINCAHDEDMIDVNDTYDGNLIRILPLDDNGSFILTVNVYVVTLFIISVPLVVNAPVNVVDTAVSDW